MKIKQQKSLLSLWLITLLISCGGDDKENNTEALVNDYSLTLTSTDLFSGDAVGQKQTENATVFNLLTRTTSDIENSIIIKDGLSIEPTNIFIATNNSGQTVPPPICIQPRTVVKRSRKISDSFRIAQIEHTSGVDENCANSYSIENYYLIRNDGKSWTVPNIFPYNFDFDNFISALSIRNKSVNPLVKVDDQLMVIETPTGSDETVRIRTIINDLTSYFNLNTINFDGQYLLIAGLKNHPMNMIYLDTKNLNILSHIPTNWSTKYPFTVGNELTINILYDANAGEGPDVRLATITPNTFNELSVSDPSRFIAGLSFGKEIIYANKLGLTDDILLIANNCDVVKYNENTNFINEIHKQNHTDKINKNKDFLYCINSSNAQVINLNTAVVENIEFIPGEMNGSKYQLSNKGIFSFIKNSETNILEKIYITYDLHTKIKTETVVNSTDDRIIIDIVPNN